MMRSGAVGTVLAEKKVFYTLRPVLLLRRWTDGDVTSVAWSILCDVMIVVVWSGRVLVSDEWGDGKMRDNLGKVAC